MIASFIRNIIAVQHNDDSRNLCLHSRRDIPNTCIDRLSSPRSLIRDTQQETGDSTSQHFAQLARWILSIHREGREGLAVAVVASIGALATGKCIEITM